jgi:hypothetical protein
MAYKFQLGKFRASGSVDVGDNDIENASDINADSISVDDAAVGLDIVFGGNTTLNKLTLTDNLADALNINEGGNSYLKFVTSNTAEQIVFGHELSGATSVDLKAFKLTADRVETDLATIDGGTINGVDIGATAQGSGKFTNISGSGVLNIEGVSKFGPGDLVQISAAGVVSGSATSTLHRVNADRAVLLTAEIAGGSIDNAAIGASTQSSGRFTTLSASSTLSVEGVSSFGPGALASINAAGVISGSGTSTIHIIDVNQLDAESATITGGSIDNATIGATAQSSGKFTTLSASSTLDVVGVSSFGPSNDMTISAAGVLSGSGVSTLHRLNLDRSAIQEVDINGGAIDGTTIGAASQSSVKATTLSASSNLSIEGVSQFGPGADVTIGQTGRVSGSSISSFHRMNSDRSVIQEVDINGGAIDGTTIGASSQSSVKATTLSASSTLNVEGVSSFGPSGDMSISAAGVLSGSGVSTLHQLTLDRATIKGGTINGTDIGANSQGSGKFTNISGSGVFNIEGASKFGPGALAQISADGIFSGSGISTLHQVVADSGSVLGRMAIGSVFHHGFGADVISAAGAFSGDNASFASTAVTNLFVDGTLGVTGNATIGSAGTDVHSVRGMLDIADANASSIGLKLNGTLVEATATELNFNDGAIQGTAVANKTVVLDASKNIATIGTIGCGAITSTGTSQFADLTITGDLTVAGTASFTNTDSLLVKDNFILIASGAQEGAAANDSGFIFRAGNNQKDHAMIYDKSDEMFALIKQTSNSADFNELATGDITIPAYADLRVGAIQGAIRNTITRHQAEDQFLSGGVNYIDAGMSNAEFSLPASPAVGDSVMVKAPSDASATNFVKIKIQGSHTVDGESFILLESPHAAVECVYVVANDWRVF